MHISRTYVTSFRQAAKPRSINKLRNVRIHYRMDFENTSMQMTKKCKCKGIIKQSAQNRLLLGNHKAHHKHFHWYVLVYQFQKHSVQCLKTGHALCQGISI